MGVSGRVPDDACNTAFFFLSSLVAYISSTRKHDNIEDEPEVSADGSSVFPASCLQVL